MKKRTFLMLFLMVTLTLSLLTVPAWAVPTSGACGESARWEFDPSTQTLTISGSGEMDCDGSITPWDYLSLSADIVHIRIEEGITAICFGAFEHCAVKSVELPKSLRHIGDNAFSGCSALLEVELHDDIQTIGSYAFSSCTKLKKVKIPSGITEISSGAFTGCTDLKEVVFHDQLKTIGSYAFCDTSLTSVVIPDSVTTIGAYAVRMCDQLRHIVLSKGMTEIGEGIFMECHALTSFTVPDWITSVNFGAFRSCYELASVDLGAGVKTVHYNAFDDCPVFKRFTVSQENPYLKASGGVLYDKQKQALLIFPWGFEGEHKVAPGTETIAEYAACERFGLTGVILPDSLRHIESSAFRNCVQMTQIDLPEGLESIGDAPFQRTSISRFVFPSTMTTMGQLLFNVSVDVQEVVFLGPFPDLGYSHMENVYCQVFYPVHDPSWRVKQHNYGGLPRWTPITCTGKHRIIDTDFCAYCGDLTQQQTCPDTGHRYGPWGPIPHAAGLEQRTCAVCGMTERRTISVPPTTQPPTVPTEPTTLPTEPVTVPTEPTTFPTEPETVPTEPTTRPTESVTVPTEPTTLPTEPETTSTEPSTVPSQPPTEAQPDPPDQGPGAVVWVTVAGALAVIGAGIWSVMKKKK